MQKKLETTLLNHNSQVKADNQFNLKCQIIRAIYSSFFFNRSINIGSRVLLKVKFNVKQANVEILQMR